MALPKNIVPFLNIHSAKRWNTRSPRVGLIGPQQKRQQKVFTAGTVAFLSLIAYISIDKWDGRNNRLVRHRDKFDFETHAQAIGESHFQRLYRITRAQFDLLSQLISSSLLRSKIRETGKVATVSVEVMLCVTLRILAGVSYLDVGWPYSMGTATAYHVFNQKLIALNERLYPISFLKSEQVCTQEAERFIQQRKSPMYGVIAALDGIALEIQQPRLADTPGPRKYFYRKGFFAISVQAAVGANYKFLFVSARHAGSTHDSTAFTSTKFHDLLSSNGIPEWAMIVVSKLSKLL